MQWQIVHQGKVLFSQSAVASFEAMNSTFQGCFSPRAPGVECRTKYNPTAKALPADCSGVGMTEHS